MFFTAAHDLVVDAKNRVSVPYAVRAKLDPERDGRAFYVLPGRRKGTLALYPDRYFERLCADVPPDGLLSDETYEWRQFEYSQTVLVDPDTQGRVLIPERLLKRAGLGREVVLAGVRDHLELWSRAEFQAFESEKWPRYPEVRAKAKQEIDGLAASGRAPAGPAVTLHTGAALGPAVGP
jgi:MraZ protein